MSSGREKFKKNKKIIYFISKMMNILSRKRQIKMFEKYNRGESKFKLVIRYCLLKNLCKNCGDNVFVGEYVTIKHFENLSIGKNVSIHKYSYIDATGSVIIGDDVSIATGCKFFSFNHTYDNANKPIKYNDLDIGEIVVGDDVWISADSIILKDVRIGKRVVVGAKSVVTKNLESNGVYVGSPAKLLRRIK